MSNYYRSTRTQRGRFGRKRIDWEKLVNDVMEFAVFSWVAYVTIDCILKAYGL